MTAQMKRVAAAIGVLILLAAVTFGWLIYRTKRAADAQRAALAAQVQPVEDALAQGRAPDPATLQRLAADVWTRAALYEALVGRHREDLFPKEHLTRASLAESALVVWLAHPNELGARPDEIALANEVTVAGAEGKKETYCVFRFRMNPPHWGAKSGWMAGIVGAYPADSADVHWDSGAFSTFDAYAEHTPEEHVKRAMAEHASASVVSTEKK